MTPHYDDRAKQAVLDEYLVLRCQEGDADALQELMRHWHRRLYGYALGQLHDPDAAKDATQDSLLSISRGIRRLKDPATFPKWAYQIVIRRCADWQRKELRWRARHVTGPAFTSATATEPAPDGPPHADPPANPYAHPPTDPLADPPANPNAHPHTAHPPTDPTTPTHPDVEALRRAITLLAPELRTVVRLHYFDSFSVREISELLEVPAGTIKSRLYYARKKLKHTIGDRET